MAKFFDEINDKLAEFIAAQKMFFVATAAEEGRINLSPKGYDAIRVLGPKRIIWLNLSGSGNETAAHLLATNRMTLMFCAFDDPPLILRIYGSATTVHPRDESWQELCSHFQKFPGERQIFDMQIDSLQTSCGFGVPLFDFAGQRPKLVNYYAAKDDDAIQQGWVDKNSVSIDGLSTGIMQED